MQQARQLALHYSVQRLIIISQSQAASGKRAGQASMPELAGPHDKGC